MYAFGEDDHGDGDDNKEDADGQVECERFAEDEYTNEDSGNGLHSSQYGSQRTTDIMDGQYQGDI